MAFFRSKLQRDRERDVTEKIALGMAGGGSQSQEAMYDQRLFNQNKVIMLILPSCLSVGIIRIKFILLLGFSLLIYN